MKNILFLAVFVLLLACDQQNKQPVNKELNRNAYNVAFLIMDGTFNTELTAPYDIFQHTHYRDSIKPMNVFTVANTKQPVTTFEGLRILPDYDYTSDTLPAIDILVVPSAEHHLDTDLEDTVMINWVKKTAADAEWVTSHCDGAFVLAHAGLLDTVTSTTFPADIDTYRERFPQLRIADSVLFVHDGKYITSAGGAKSFEAALYLTELLYGKDKAQELADGLVIDWTGSEVPHMIIQQK
ncbi:glutamine amidotransferase [Robertkochia marina]|uniref:Glutamine amidotransferase n=1 Tax=Robertkochia marina TaxID=1227945 RepID=A0A4V6RRS5_9FLAO|nr:DJ-1/PfpI family protein [Robertkochia marina]THD66554.1 glutamine amidotransferase [Robertkochia marina]TRZ45686.1 glutamine amidotransferase [Robertkochia marina]